VDLNPVLDPVLNPVRDLGEFIREQRTAAQISIRGLAAKAGVSNPYLSQVERGLRRPSADILAQIAHGLSISVESLLAKAGILESAESPAVVSAIRGDAVLTERQKSALIDIYAAFRKEAESALTLTAGSAVTLTAGSDAPAEPGLLAGGRGDSMPIFAERTANTEAPAVNPDDRAVGPGVRRSTRRIRQ
jgi:transcriptional regulator with XRE-family HTH domain